MQKGVFVRDEYHTRSKRNEILIGQLSFYMICFFAVKHLK